MEVIFVFVYLNVNPDKNRTIDCVIRAVSFVTKKDWDTTFMHIAVKCMKYHDMPEVNYVWAEYLTEMGFRRHMIPDTCPLCYTVNDFCKDHPIGTFLLVIVGYGERGGHVVAVEFGNHYDTWDSGNEVVTYYWEKVMNDAV